MEFIKHTPFTKLNSSTIKWTVRARAQAVWKGITRETKEFRGLNLLLVDDSRSRIHGFIAAKLAPLFEKDIVEGEVYQISNFIVQEYTGMEFNRCVRFEKHIFFAHYTKMERCTSTDLTIPKIVVDLFSLKDIATLEQDKRFLCDVCGVLKEQQEFRDYLNDNDEPKQQKKFTLTDGSSEISVTLFDDLAKSFDEQVKNRGRLETTIVILSSVKIGRFQGDLNLTNYPASRFYINAEHHAVKKLEKRAKTSNFIVTQEETLTQLETIDIKEMCVAGIKKIESEAKVVSRLIVKKIQENLNWFFYVCTKCSIELDFKDGRYKCPHCSRFFPWPQKRFRLFVLCCDATGVLPLLLGDREIRKLTGKMVFDVELDLTEEEDGKFPPVLTKLLNKEYFFTISVNEENIAQKSDVYEVCDIQLDINEKIKNLTTVEEISEEPEDDQSIQDMELITQTSRTAPKKKKKTREIDSAKNTEASPEVGKKGSLRKLKNIKIKKERLIVKNKKKNNSITQQAPADKVKSRKLIDVISESDDEEMTLNTYQMKNKKQA